IATRSSVRRASSAMPVPRPSVPGSRSRRPPARCGSGTSIFRELRYHRDRARGCPVSQFDAYRYDGKRAVVVGGASGMGAATAALVGAAGADVVVMDFADVRLPEATAIHVDLADSASIDAAVDECGGRVDALFACAGVADGTPGIERINFLGHRHLIDRARARGMLAKGSTVGFIS